MSSQCQHYCAGMHVHSRSSHPGIGTREPSSALGSDALHADRVGLILFLLFPVLTAGKELFGLDTLQKSLWIQLLEEMFLGMPSEFPWGDEIMLFLNVFNGALILHPEDSALLRQYAATVINSAVHFNHLFSLSGYQWILPTMLQVRGLCSPDQAISCPSSRSTKSTLKMMESSSFVTSESTTRNLPRNFYNIPFYPETPPDLGCTFPFLLGQWSSKYKLWTSSISISWEFVRNAHSWVLFQTYFVRTSEVREQ